MREALESGINVLDLAPSYGNGEAESVIGEAFDGALPAGVRLTTKCRVGATPPEQVYDLLSTSLEGSLERMKLERVDIMFLHNAVTLREEAGERVTSAATVAEAVAPAFERLIAEGRVGNWGLTGISHSDALIHFLTNGPRPDYIQCIANLLDSAGGLFQGTELHVPATLFRQPMPTESQSWASEQFRLAPSRTPSTGPCRMGTRKWQTTRGPSPSVPSLPTWVSVLLTWPTVTPFRWRASRQ